MSELLQSVIINPADIGQSVLASCNQCGAETANDKAGLQAFGACSCRQCNWAHYCFLLMKEVRKAAYQKKDAQKTFAMETANKCSQAYRGHYGEDWRARMHKTMPSFEIMLGQHLAEPLNINALSKEAKEKYYIN